MYPILSALAKQAGKLPFEHRFTEQRENEIKARAFDDHTPLHGGIGRAFPAGSGGNYNSGTFQIKTYIGGKYLVLGYFPVSRVVDALRYADMATIFFAKYKTSRGLSVNYLQSNRGNLAHIFNTSEAEAYQDIERETRIVTHFKDIELAAEQLGCLKNVPVAALDTVTMQQRIGALEANVKLLADNLNQLIAKTEKWKDEMFKEIFKNWKQ